MYAFFYKIKEMDASIVLILEEVNDVLTIDESQLTTAVNELERNMKYTLENSKELIRKQANILLDFLNNFGGKESSANVQLWDVKLKEYFKLLVVIKTKDEHACWFNDKQCIKLI